MRVGEGHPSRFEVGINEEFWPSKSSLKSSSLEWLNNQKKYTFAAMWSIANFHFSLSCGQKSHLDLSQLCKTQLFTIEIEILTFAPHGL